MITTITTDFMNGSYAIDLPMSYEVVGNRGLKDLARDITKYFSNKDINDGIKQTYLENLLVTMRRVLIYNTAHNIEFKVNSALDIEAMKKWVELYKNVTTILNDNMDKLNKVFEITKDEDELQQLLSRVVFGVIRDKLPSFHEVYVTLARDSKNHYIPNKFLIQVFNYSGNTAGIHLYMHVTKKKHIIKISEKFTGLKPHDSGMGYKSTDNITVKSVTTDIMNFDDELEDLVSEYTEV